MASTNRLGGPFWVVWSAGSVSYLGDGLVVGAMPLLAASLTRDPRLISLVDASLTLGWLILGLISGVVVDRVDRLGLMWRVDAIRAVLATGFVALVLAGRASMAVLLGFSLLLGLAAPFFDNAASSVLPDLVGEKDFERANSATQMSMIVLTNLLGPPVGAALFVVTVGAPFAINALSFLIAAALVWIYTLRRKAPPAQRPEPDRMLAQVRAGMAFLGARPVLRTLAVTVGVINLAVGGVVAILVLYVLEELDLPQQAYGWLIAVFAVGGVLGSVATPWLVRRAGQSAATLASVVVFGVTLITLGASTNLVFVIPALVLAGLASIVWNVVTISYRQRVVPRELLGRVTSVYRMIAFLAIPIGAAGAGLLAHQIGIRATYAVGGVLILVAGVAAQGRIREMSPRSAPTP